MPETWKQELRELRYNEPARYAIVDSWARCRQARLERDGDPAFRQIGAEELEQRLRKCGALVELAQPRMQQLLQRLPGSTNVVYIVDADGIVLASAGAPDQIAAFALAPGYDWSEKQMGTNGAGTALATRNAVAVVGEEHFLSAFDNCTCTAAPIYGHDRSVIGALDVSSSVADALPERLAEVIRVADAISQELYQRWRQSEETRFVSKSPFVIPKAGTEQL
jgi:transcriptional regulator of acetoin/glycerol metabolism